MKAEGRRPRLNTNARGEVVTVTLIEPAPVLMPDTNGEAPDPSGATHTVGAGRYAVVGKIPEGWIMLDHNGMNWIVTA